MGKANNECKCESCRQACQFKPGWFLPGEAEKVAEYLGVSLIELFNTRLAVDYWVGGIEDGDTFLLSPVTEAGMPGTEFPFDPRGKCTFYTDEGLCEIHSVKPFECRDLWHDDTSEKAHERHEITASAWRKCQGDIAALLGHEPDAGDFDFLDGLSFMSSMLMGW